MAREFDNIMDLLVRGAEHRYSHMYEWPALAAGTPEAGRLWGHTLKGRGAKKEATFVFLVSKLPIKTALERSEDPNDPISGVAMEDIVRLAEGGEKRYVFRQKARAIEFGLQVNIRPRGKNMLFIPTRSAARGFVFSSGVTTTPGNAEQRGAFTSQWVTWWSKSAPEVWNRSVKDLERRLDPETQVKRKTRKKTVGIYMVNNEQAAFIEGRNMARSRVRAGAKSLAASRRYARKYGEDLIIDG
jgi:hypothetical protein